MPLSYATTKSPSASIAIAAIGWSTGDVLFKRYSRTGTKLNAAVTVNIHMPNTQQLLELAMDADGDLIFAWDGEGKTNDNSAIVPSEVFHQRYGYRAPVGVEVNSQTFNSGETAVTVPGFNQLSALRFFSLKSA